MVRVLVLLVASLLVIAAMGLTLTWFFRRLAAIQKDYWGDKPDLTDQGIRAAVRRLLRGRSRKEPGLP